MRESIILTIARFIECIHRAHYSNYFYIIVMLYSKLLYKANPLSLFYR